MEVRLGWKYGWKYGWGGIFQIPCVNLPLQLGGPLDGTISPYKHVQSLVSSPLFPINSKSEGQVTNSFVPCRTGRAGSECTDFHAGSNVVQSASEEATFRMKPQNLVLISLLPDYMKLFLLIGESYIILYSYLVFRSPLLR